MKLADSWTEDVPALPALATFHDEVEEDDEVDEAEDGCGGVCVEKYVLTKARTSNKQLHELAREVRGVENRRGKRFSLTQYKAIFQRWERPSKPFLRVGHDYFTEFLARLDCVSVPKGETLQAAFERAKNRPPPSKVCWFPMRGCDHLQACAASFRKWLAINPSCCAKRALQNC